MDKVKIVFVGVGGMGQVAHLKNYVLQSDCEIIAIIEPREKLGKAVAQRYSITNVFTSIEDFKKSGISFDGFVSAQPYRNQKNIMPELYAFGKPVLSEKPISLGIEVGKELVALAKANGVTHVMGYHKRSDPAMEFAIAIADEWKSSGKFGNFNYLRATMPAGDWVANGFDGVITTDDPYPPCDLEPDVNYFENEKNNKDYDAFVNYFIHQINAIRLLFGEDYNITYGEKTQKLLVGKSVSGKPAILEMSPWNNSVDWQESYLLAFDKGWILIELPAPLISNQPGRVTVYEDNGQQSTPIKWSPTLPHIHAMRNQAMNFIKFIKGEKDAKCTSEEAVKDLELAKQYIEIISTL
jgi:predicted dehydrogenase